jgi:ABC-type oligopeptide transport system substrate-binding subunit
VIGAVLALTGVIVPLRYAGAQSAASHPNALAVLNLNINTGDADFVKTLDPALPTDSISYYDIQLVNANLVKPSYPSLAVVPDLATWKVSANHKVYTFTIRSNARFSNGDPVTAADAAWSLTRALLPSSKSPVAALYLAPIKGAAELAAGKAQRLTGVKVLGPRTLQMTLTAPYAYFLNTLTYPTADVLDKKHMAGKKVDTYLDNNCKGNQGAGPFEFVCTGGSGHNSFFPAGHSPYFDFKPNPYYYGAKPQVMIHAPFIADSDAQWRLFRSGAIDATSVPTSDIGIAKHLTGYSQRPALETDYITPNRAEPPFDNLNCRLAVAYGIDRYAITERLLKGTEGPLYDVLPPGLPSGGQGYFGAGKKEGVPYYNPTKAKAYLSACPGHLKNVTLTYQKTSADLTHEYDAITFELNQLGAGITLKPLTFNEWLNVVGQSMTVTKTQITENLWIDDYPDGQDWLAQLLQTGANYDIGSFSNHTYDQLVNQGNVTFNPARRAAIYKRAQKIALNDGAWIGVGYADTPWVVSPKLHNIIYTDGNIYPVNNDWSQAS